MVQPLERRAYRWRPKAGVIEPHLNAVILGRAEREPRTQGRFRGELAWVLGSSLRSPENDNVGVIH